MQNTALKNGKAVVLTPGHYVLSDAIIMSKSNGVLLSLGMCSLENTPNKPAIIVADNLSNIIISGLLIQASDNSTLLSTNNYKTLMLNL